MTTDTSKDLGMAETTEAEAALVSAALKLSLLAQQEEESPNSRNLESLSSRNLRLAGNSNAAAAERPPCEESSAKVVGRQKTGTLALFRWQIQHNFRSFSNLIILLVD